VYATIRRSVESDYLITVRQIADLMPSLTAVSASPTSIGASQFKEKPM